MTLSLDTLAYKYEANSSLVNWLKTSYKVNGIGETGEDIQTLLAQLDKNSGFNPYDALDSYAPGLENSPMGDYINEGVKYTLTSFYKQKDYDYYSYTTGYTGVDALAGNDALDPETGTMDGNITTVMGDVANYGIMVDGALQSINTAGAAGNEFGKDALVDLYRKLTEEMRGLKEYTLSNVEIQEAIDEINTLNGDGIIKSLENKIVAAQLELSVVFKNQLEKLTDNVVTLNEDNKPVYTDSGIFRDITNVASSDETDDKIYNPTETNTTRADAAPGGAISNLINIGAEELITSSFYKYYVALRTDPKLTFEAAFNTDFAKYNTAKPEITNDKLGDYDGIAKGDERIGPIGILKGLYGTQELLALYKQYEETLNKAKSMELSLTMAIKNSTEFDFRKKLADAILLKLNNGTTDIERKLILSNEIGTVRNIKRGSSVGPSAQRAGLSNTTTFDGFFGDVNTVGDSIDMGNGPATVKGALVDPYEIDINGTKYIMGRDANSNGSIDNISEILGITDTMENPFLSLLQLDANKDGFVSKDELAKNGIVLKAVDSAGKLTKNSYDISLVNGIDLKKLNPLKDGNSVGTFEMTFLNGRTSQGSQTFEDQTYFNTLFGKLVDLSAYQTKTAVATTTATKTATSTATATSTTAVKTATTTSTVDASARATLLKQINSMYSALIIDDTSNVETILDNLCWKKSTILTPAQRIRIVDSIDPLMPVYRIEAEINNALKTLNN